MRNLYKTLALVSVILAIVVVHIWGLPAFLRYLHVPVEEYDYLIFQDDAFVKAKNGKNGAIDFRSTNASKVMNQAIDQGNIIYIKRGEYTLNSDLLVYNKKRARIIGYGASIQCNGKRIVIQGDDYTSSQHNALSGLEIVNGTVEIENSFGITIADMIFRNCTRAVELVNTETWSEGTKIERCHFINSVEGIVFRTPAIPATGSYASTEISNCFFNLYRDNSVGIKIEPNASFTDSIMQNVRLWMGEFSQRNQTGILVEGSMLQTLLQNVIFESFARAKLPTNIYGMEFGQNAESPILGEGTDFLGNWTARVHNPNGVWIFKSGGSFKRTISVNDLSIGQDDEYGSAQTIDAYRQRLANFKVRIQVGGTFGYGENLTIRFRLEFLDNSISKSVEKSFNQTATVWLDDDDYLELAPAQNIIWAILVDAKTNYRSTNTTLQIDVYGTTA